MRTFTRCLVVMAALVAMTVPAWSQVAAVPAAPAMTSSDSLVAIDRLARKIAVANPQYPDPYQVPIGVMISVPTTAGPKVFYETEPWQYGKLGCWWQIAAWHLFAKRMEPPDADARVILPLDDTTAVKTPPVVQTEAGWFPLAILLTILAALAAIAIAKYYRIRQRKQRRQEEQAQERQMERRMDYRNDPPVVAGGLSEDPAQALSQIRAADALYHRDEPGRQVSSARHGTLRSMDDRERVALRVEHTGSNGLETADRWVNNGDRCTEVWVSVNGGQPFIEYWLRHCGNRFGEIRDGRFQMPDGWEFVPDSIVAATVPAATVQTQPEAPADQSAAEAITAPALANRRNRPGHPDKFSAKVIVTNNGGDDPATKRTIDVTADRFVTSMELPDGTKITF